LQIKQAFLTPALVSFLYILSYEGLTSRMHITITSLAMKGLKTRVTIRGGETGVAGAVRRPDHPLQDQKKRGLAWFCEVPINNYNNNSNNNN